ncbi:guanine deaminase isoform X2 [Hyperolius riggenbachi]|uniref:guanine deaminase isoform X2 n=1 Tax=Hyperolius riggenbachi TaxID=752182 RepID=UPI0035A36E1C
MDTVQHVFKGTFVHSTKRGDMEVLENHILATDMKGKILFLEDAQSQARLAQKWGFDDSKIEELGKNEFFMPGMVDTHIHAPQYSFIGTGMERPLLEWLQYTTFPTENIYSDVEVAKTLYNSVVRRTLKNGTTTACYFGTIHTDASIVLADIASQYGQRAFIGKVCMDTNDVYPKYVESTEESIKETTRFIEALKKKKYDRVKPIVTPRFAVSCSEKLLSDLGQLAEENQLHIQSHISESLAEIDEVLRLFPDYKNYTEVYGRNKLLTHKTVMAHGCYLSNEELLVFKEKGAALSHCPNSNISLCSGHLDVRNVLKHKVKLGLGTALSIDHIVGNFQVNKEFDALRINLEALNSPFEVFSDISKEEMVQRFLFLGDDRNITAVYVAGRRVMPLPSNA